MSKLSAVRSLLREDALAETETLRTNRYCFNPFDWADFRPPDTKVVANIKEIFDIATMASKLVNKYQPGVTPSDGPGRVIGMEVGDDREDISDNPYCLALSLAVQEKVFKMKTSWEDTSISREKYNFCEVTSFLPSTKSQSFDFARRTGDFRNLGFIDSLIPRIIEDVSKGDQSHSSTSVGKVAMLASRENTPNAKLRFRWQLSSLFQDSLLSTARSTEPKYLPRIMGGSGARQLFDDHLNVYLYMKAYRGGGYDRIYGSAVKELMDCLRSYDRGDPTFPILCQRLRDKQEYLHGTYAEKIFVPDKRKISLESVNMPMPLYEASSCTNDIRGTENRLIRSRLVIGERAAGVQLAVKAKLEHQLTSGKSTSGYRRQERLDSLRRREKFEFALNANSAFKALLRRKATPGDPYMLALSGEFQVLTCGAREFSKEYAAWLGEGGKSETSCISEISFAEAIYLSAEISSEESLKVPGIVLKPFVGNVKRPTTTKSKLGLYEISGSMYDWAHRKVDQLVEARGRFEKPVPLDTILEIYRLDPEWVNDDTLIVSVINRISASTSSTDRDAVILISSDRRLASQASKTSNLQIWRIEPADLIEINIRPSYNSETTITVSELLPFLSEEILKELEGKLLDVIIDTGSLSAAAVKYSANSQITPLKNEQVFTKEVTSYGCYESTLQRHVSVTYKKCLRRNKLNVQIIRPFGSKHFRGHKPLGDVYLPNDTKIVSQGGSWR